MKMSSNLRPCLVTLKRVPRPPRPLADGSDGSESAGHSPNDQGIWFIEPMREKPPDQRPPLANHQDPKPKPAFSAPLAAPCALTKPTIQSEPPDLGDEQPNNTVKIEPTETDQTGAVTSDVAITTPVVSKVKPCYVSLKRMSGSSEPGKEEGPGQPDVKVNGDQETEAAIVPKKEPGVAPVYPKREQVVATVNPMREQVVATVNPMREQMVSDAVAPTTVPEPVNRHWDLQVKKIKIEPPLTAPSDSSDGSNATTNTEEGLIGSCQLQVDTTNVAVAATATTTIAATTTIVQQPPPRVNGHQVAVSSRPDRVNGHHSVPPPRNRGGTAKRYKCHVCERSYARSRELKHHALSHLGKNLFKCTLCPERFTRLGNLNRHQQTHANERQQLARNAAACDTSDLSNASATADDMPFMCDICGEVFAELATLNAHHHHHLQPPTPVSQQQHITPGKKKVYQCDQCPQTFTSLKTLNIHLREHARTSGGDPATKPYQCDLCGKAYKNRYKLNDHIKNHNGFRPFRCDVCHKAFMQRQHLIQHARTHTGERPYKCDRCDKTFAQASNLNAHALTHLNHQRRYASYDVGTEEESAAGGEEQVDFGGRSVSLNTLIYAEPAAHESPFDDGDLCEDDYTHLGNLHERSMMGHTYSLDNPYEDELYHGGGGYTELPVLNEHPSTSGGAGGGHYDELVAHDYHLPAAVHQHQHPPTLVEESASFEGVLIRKEYTQLQNLIGYPPSHQPLYDADLWQKDFTYFPGAEPGCAGTGDVHPLTQTYETDLSETNFASLHNFSEHPLNTTYDNSCGVADGDDDHHHDGPFASLHSGLGEQLPPSLSSSCSSSQQACEVDTSETDLAYLQSLNEESLGRALETPTNEYVHIVTYSEQQELGKPAVFVHPQPKKSVNGHSAARRKGESRERGAVRADRKLTDPSDGAREGAADLASGTNGQSGAGSAADDKPFHCEQCDKSFRRRTSLAEHVWCHSGQKPFKCEVCGKGYVRSLELRNHARIHTGDNPYKCSVCAKTYTRHWDFKRHVQTHEPKTSAQACPPPPPPEEVS